MVKWYDGVTVHGCGSALLKGVGRNYQWLRRNVFLAEKTIDSMHLLHFTCGPIDSLQIKYLENPVSVEIHCENICPNGAEWCSNKAVALEPIPKLLSAMKHASESGNINEAKGAEPEERYIMYTILCRLCANSLYFNQIWAQTILEVDVQGNRTGKRLRATIVPNRSAEVLDSNIADTVEPGALVQTDMWKGYAHVKGTYDHQTVNHRREFVRRSARGIVSINTIESAHSHMKRNARRLNLFSGQRSQGIAIQQKVDELVFRYNNRDNRDMFLCVIQLILVHYPCCENMCQLFEQLSL